MAMRAARSPSHGSGSRNPNMASEGMVCRILANAITGFAHRGARVSHMPAGTAIATAKSMAAPVSQRCSSVNVAISPAYCEKKVELIRELLQRFVHRDGRHARRPQFPIPEIA